MNRHQFWQLVDVARDQAPDPHDPEDVARRATALLATHPAEEIVAAQQVLWDLMADSYVNPLWAAAYLINGGCSDDGFDYFRGWLIAQGREVFERAVAGPDTLADLPGVRAAAAAGHDLECEGCWASSGTPTPGRPAGTSPTMRSPSATRNWTPPGTPPSTTTPR